MGTGTWESNVSRSREEASERHAARRCCELYLVRGEHLRFRFLFTFAFYDVLHNRKRWKVRLLDHALTRKEFRGAHRSVRDHPCAGRFANGRQLLLARFSRDDHYRPRVRARVMRYAK